MFIPIEDFSRWPLDFITLSSAYLFCSEIVKYSGQKSLVNFADILRHKADAGQNKKVSLIYSEDRTKTACNISKVLGILLYIIEFYVTSNILFIAEHFIY